MTFVSAVPAQYAFLNGLETSFRGISDKGYQPYERLEICLHYSSRQSSYVEFNGTLAVVHLDVRFVDTIVDLISCLRLEDDGACAARAFLVVCGLALDLALESDETDLVAGLAQDYVVSRVTAEVEVADVTSPDVDFKGDDLAAIGEKVALFVCAHEVTHWLLNYDNGFRARTLDRVRRFFDNLAENSEAADPGFRTMVSEMAEEFRLVDHGTPLPSRIEEWVCDLVAGEALSDSARSSASRDSVEVAIIAANVTLWAWARLRSLLRLGLVPADELDRNLALERGSISMIAALSARYLEWGGSSAPAPQIPLVDRLTSVVTTAIAGFLDGQNVVRLRAIGKVSLEFGLTNSTHAHHALAKIRDWS